MTRTITTPTASYELVRADMVAAARMRARMASQLDDGDSARTITREAWEQDCDDCPAIYDLDHLEMQEIRHAWLAAYSGALC